MIRVGAQYLGGPMSPKTFARAVEAAELDSVWCGDHVGHYIDAIATLGCFAGCTDRIVIGSNVLVAPLRPAAVTAKGLLTAAAIAGPDRTVAGIGIGGEFPAEFEAVGADIRTRGKFADEMLEVMELLWSGEAVTYEGRWTSLDDFKMEPRLEPRPRVWIGGRSDAALRRTARFGDGYLGYLLSPRGLAERVGKLRRFQEEAGSTTQLTIAANVIFMLGLTADEAVGGEAAAAMKLEGMSPELASSFFLLGDDEQCIARIREYVDAGLDHLILGCPPGDDEMLSRFIAHAKRLLPIIRTLDRERDDGSTSRTHA